MNVVFAFFLTGLVAVLPQEELQERAREIVRKGQQNEITTSEARRQVQLLLKDLKKWSEAEGVALAPRTRVFSSPATAPGEALTVDRCAIFYEENLERLCPIDVSRSEVWSAAVLFCRYLCAPAPP
ncbi:MAG: hypothetical protein ACRD21_18645 [Vicinamibacteria bacterium]